MMHKARQFLLKSFSLRLSFMLLIVAGSIFYLVFYINYRITYNNERQDAIAHSQATLDNTILRIDKVLHSVEIAVQNMAWTVAENLDNPDYMYTVTRRILANNDFVHGSAIAFEPYFYEDKGVFYSPYAYRDHGVIKSKQLGSSSYDYHYMDWYQIPRLLNQPYWSEPYYDDGGGEMIMTTYSYPLYDERGRLYAIFTADVSLEWFTEQINQIKPYPNAYNMMMGRGGTYLVHERSDAILNESIFNAAIIENDDEIMDMAHRMVNGERGLAEVERNGQRVFLCYAPIQATGWSVAVCCLQSEIFAGVYLLRKLFFWLSIVGLCMMILWSFFAIRRLTKPLTKFAQAANDIAQGNFSAQLPVIKSDDEMRLLYDSFRYMQQSLRNYMTQLKTTTANKERIESELRIAHLIQMGMVPKIFPPFPEREDIDVYARLIPAKEVGGDLYDFFIRDDHFYFIIGDVSGKGVPASLVMAVTCRLFRTIASYIDTPHGIVAALNDTLSESNESNMFCTAFVGILNLKSGHLQYCNAGHNPPIMILPSGEVEVLPIASNLAMGVWSGFEYTGESYDLPQGATLFMYTDGVTEAENVEKQLYSEEKLVGLLSQSSAQVPRKLVEQVLADISNHAGGADQSDDITILCCNLHQQPGEEDNMQIVLRNDISEIERMASFLNDLGDKLDIAPDVMFNIHLALEEAVTNVIMYAYPPGEENQIVLTVHQIDNRLIFKIIDSGKEFDPTQQPDADVTLSLEERPIGGLGIFLIRRIMQAVEYRREDGKNIFTMAKVLDGEKTISE